MGADRMMYRRTLLAMALAMGAMWSTARVAASTEFAACISNLQKRARAEGVAEDVVKRLGQVEQRQRILDLDRRQPEAAETFAEYLRRRVTDTKIEEARAFASEHKRLLERVSRRYGVPAPYLLAFWGIESHFGRHVGDIPVLDSITTLACDERRAASFSRQLMAALHILDRRLVLPERFTGSWAGAMGNFQFMPTVFLRYGVDFDGDGLRNLWDFPDALASAGNFLRGLGWKPGIRWGREVTLPEGFPVHLADGKTARPLRRWRRLGVREANGRRLPASSLKAALLLPSGHRGPAFVVYRNYHAIMRWNQSSFFALAVGHLADRIEGGRPLHRPPPDDEPRLSRQAVQTLQERLHERGFDCGEPDGVSGSATRDAIRAFQRKHGLVADGYPGPEVIEALGGLDGQRGG